MEIPTDLAADLKEFTATSATNGDGLTETLQSWMTQTKRAVSSLLGVSITIHRQGHGVTLSSLSERAHPCGIKTSLRLPLETLAGNVYGVAVFFAAVPGAFVDLDADLRHVLNLADDALRLDQDLRPSMLSGINGADELSTINKAIGVLIEHGYPIEAAEDEVRRQAVREGLNQLQAAERLLKIK